MQITKTGKVYKASRISGPKYNYLALSVTASPPPGKLKVIRRTLKGELAASEIDETKLVHAVLEGTRKGNESRGTSLSIDTIEFVSSDTPDYEVYRELAKAIIVEASKDFLSNQSVEHLHG